MSFYSFIATNYEIPEVDKTKAKYITKEVYRDVSGYTSISLVLT